jgi:hypothetical protein
MTKEDLLEHLKEAKEAHIKWLQKAKMLISGVDLKENAIPVNAKECPFAKWFYSEGQLLNKLSNNPLECMMNIEKLHLELHDKYLNIFEIYFSKKRKRGFLLRFLGISAEMVSDEEQERAQEYYKHLREISQEFLAEISRLERRVGAVSSEKIESLC